VPTPPDAERSDAAGYTLSRLTARRTVRAAVALSRLRQGPAAAREAYRHPAALEDPGPRPARHLREAHLRVAHLASVPLTDATAPGVRLDAASWRTQLDVQRPDLVLLDAPEPWVDTDLVRALRTHTGAPVVATAEVATRLAGAALDLVIDPDDPDGPGAPAVDHRVDNPVGSPTDPTLVAGWGPGQPLPDAGPAVVVVTEPEEQRRAAVTGALRLAARGIVVVAPAGGAVDRALGDVAVTAAPADLAARARGVAGDPVTRERTSVRQRRHVLRHHTIDDRARQLLAAAGVHLRPPPRVSVLLATRRPDQVAPALAAVVGQRWDDLEVQLVVHGFEVDATQLEAGGRRLEVHHVPADRPLGEVLNVGLDAATGELIAKMDDDDLYGTGHLADLAVALRYSGAEVVGRWANLTHLVDDDVTVDPHRDRQERWAHHLPGATMLIHGHVLRRLRWRHVPHGVDRELVRAIHADGGRTYATHRYGFVRRRHGDHTFARGDRAFAREGATSPGLDRAVLDV
jgi:glycosyltransferase involved in cell wall biosynthesis